MQALLRNHILPCLDHFSRTLYVTSDSSKGDLENVYSDGDALLCYSQYVRDTAKYYI